MNIPILIIYSIILLLVFSICLFLFIVLRRIITKSIEKKFKKKYRQIEKDVLNALSSPQPELSLLVARKYKSYPNVLIQVLINYMEIIKGSENKRLKIIFDQTLKKRYLKNLYSRRIVKRLKAARLFTIFSDPSEAKHLIKLLNDKPIVRFTAINALSRIPSQDTLSYIFQAFEKDSNSNIEAYFNIMFGLGDKIESFIKKHLKKSLSVEKIGLLIDLVGYILLRSLYHDILVFSNHPDKEIRIRVARALGNLSIPDTVKTLITLSSDPSWEVQAQAIKSLGKIKSLEALDILTEALSSSFWYVRLYAGHGLTNLGLQGIRRLEEVSHQNKDRHASEMATMALSDIIYFKGVL